MAQLRISPLQKSFCHRDPPFRKRCQSASDVTGMGEPRSALAFVRNSRKAPGLTSAAVDPWQGTDVALTTPTTTPEPPLVAGPADGADPPVPVPSNAVEPESPLHVPGRAAAGLALPGCFGAAATGLAKKRSWVGLTAEDATRGRRCSTPEVYEAGSSTLVVQTVNHVERGGGKMGYKIVLGALGSTASQYGGACAPCPHLSPKP